MARTSCTANVRVRQIVLFVLLTWGGSHRAIWVWWICDCPVRSRKAFMSKALRRARGPRLRFTWINQHPVIWQGLQISNWTDRRMHIQRSTLSLRPAAHLPFVECPTPPRTGALHQLAMPMPSIDILLLAVSSTLYRPDPCTPCLESCAVFCWYGP